MLTAPTAQQHAHLYGRTIGTVGACRRDVRMSKGPKTLPAATRAESSACLTWKPSTISFEPKVAIRKFTLWEFIMLCCDRLQSLVHFKIQTCLLKSGSSSVRRLFTTFAPFSRFACSISSERCAAADVQSCTSSLAASSSAAAMRRQQCSAAPNNSAQCY